MISIEIPGTHLGMFPCKTFYQKLLFARPSF